MLSDENRTTVEDLIIAELIDSLEDDELKAEPIDNFESEELNDNVDKRDFRSTM